MKKLNETLDFYVRSLKNSITRKDIKFVFAGKTVQSQFPLESFLVACSAGNSDIKNTASGRVMNTTFHLDVYAHKSASKRDLSLLCSEFISTLSKVSVPYTVEAIEVSEAVYDSNFCVWRQQIRIKLQKANSGEYNSPFELYLNSRFIESLIDFKEVITQSLYPVKELLSETSGYADTGKSESMLVITTAKEIKSNYLYSFTLAVSDSEEEYLYEGCKVIEQSAKKDSSGERYEYTVVYEKKSVK